jgi:hypothetical protein
MTELELSRVPFKCVCSASWEHEHTLTYSSSDGRLGFCMHTPKKSDGSFGKGRTHYRIDKKVYKSKKKFLEALVDFSPKIIPMYD